MSIYRQHTFAVKGPNRRELRDYIDSLGKITPPTNEAPKGFSKGWAKENLWPVIYVMHGFVDGHVMPTFEMTDDARRRARNNRKGNK